MSYYTINVDDKVITEQITAILNEILYKEMNRKYGETDDLMRACIKDLIYDHKEEILEKVIDRATKEIVRKGLPRLLEKV